MTVTEFDAPVDEDDVDTCPGCEDNDQPHDCGYTNDDCPSGCETEHDVDAEYGEFTCPETNDRYVECYECGWVELGRYEGAVEGPGNRWGGANYYCPACAEDIRYCDECGDAIWYDDARYSRDGDYCYCADCFRDNASEFHGGSPERLRTCGSCGTTTAHMNLVTEAFLCDHEAVRADLDGQPILFAHPVPATVEYLNDLLAVAS